MSGFPDTIAALKRPGGLFDPDRPVYIARSPGRIDLMGGNVDYTGGLVFQSTIREATWAAVQLNPGDRIKFVNPQVSGDVEFSLADLVCEDDTRAAARRDARTAWTAYTLGLFYFLRRNFPGQVRCGAVVYVESEIPLSKGVSSSAAIEVSVMLAAARAYGVSLAGIDLALACQWVENVIAGAGCGIMDQAAVLLGDEGHVLPLLCQPCTVLPLVKLADELETWGIDSGVSHAVSGIEYEAVRAASFMGARMIREWGGPDGYLSDIAPSLFRARFESCLPESISGEEFLQRFRKHIDPFSAVRPGISYRVRACTRYSIEENHRIRLFVELARHSSRAAFESMGELMYQSHWSYTECGLGNEATDLLVELVRAQGAPAGLFGSRVSGGGAGGTVAVLGLKSARGALHRVVEQFAAARGFTPHVFEGSSPGAERYGVRVI